MSASMAPRALMPATIPVESTRIFRDEWAVRYGVLMGGTKVVNLDGIGQYYVGHHQIPRRALIGFTRQVVGGRNEAADSEALDAPGGGLLAPSPLETKRVMDKSPALCMREMIQQYGAKGFFNSQVLMGDEETADQIFNAVLPVNIAALPLVDVIAFLEDESYITKSQFLDSKLKGRANQFREECLQGGYVTRAYLTSYTSAISDEIESDKKTGKKKVDAVDTEYYWELKLTLPKDKPLEATSMLGREIAGAMSKGNDNSEMVAEMREANRLKAEELEIRRLELGQVKNQLFACECSDTFDSAQGLQMHKNRWCKLKQSVAE